MTSASLPPSSINFLLFQYSTLKVAIHPDVEVTMTVSLSLLLSRPITHPRDSGSANTSLQSFPLTPPSEFSSHFPLGSSQLQPNSFSIAMANFAPKLFDNNGISKDKKMLLNKKFQHLIKVTILCCSSLLYLNFYIIFKQKNQLPI